MPRAPTLTGMLAVPFFLLTPAGDGGKGGDGGDGGNGGDGGAAGSAAGGAIDVDSATAVVTATVTTAGDHATAGGLGAPGAGGSGGEGGAGGEASPYSWSAFDLPPGLSIDTRSGVISGAPTAAGAYKAVHVAKVVTAARRRS